MTENKSTTVEEEIEAIRGIESLGDTEFSMLFHEARTTSRHHYTGVAAAWRVRDGELEIGDVVKTRQGEHYHVRDAPYDGTVTLPVKSFMDTRTARQEIVRQLQDLQRTYLVKEQREEERRKVESGEWSR